MTCAAHGLALSRRFLVPEDVDLIQSAAHKLSHQFPKIRVVDIGAGSGTTALSCFCALPNGRVIVVSIDNSRDNLNWAELAVTNAGYLPWWRGRCVGVDSLPVIRPHLLLVDGDHTRAGVESDLCEWLPMLFPSSLIWFHDYNPPDAYPGVREVVVASKLKVIEERGLGVLCSL